MYYTLTYDYDNKIYRKIISAKSKEDAIRKAEEFVDDEADYCVSLQDKNGRTVKTWDEYFE